MVDDFDADGFVRAGLGADGRFTHGEAACAHVAFADNAFARGILGHVVRAFEHAILAADALVIEMMNDPGGGIFLVGKNRAARGAGGIDAVVAACGDRLKVRRFRSMDRADVAPHFVFVEAVERVAGADASFAAGATVEVDDKSVLLAGFGFAERDEFAVALRGRRRGVVIAREAFDRGQVALIS